MKKKVSIFKDSKSSVFFGCHGFKKSDLCIYYRIVSTHLVFENVERRWKAIKAPVRQHKRNGIDSLEDILLTTRPLARHINQSINQSDCCKQIAQCCCWLAFLEFDERCPEQELKVGLNQPTMPASFSK
ncbi:unnamed protein product [Amoebophrya sp. A25]|nr:unnamed protein product [Amoebophrya sp. A25]|eukprot:GSA25T00009631001.1